MLTRLLQSATVITILCSSLDELKGEIVPDTGEMVFKAMLDSEGRFFSQKSGDGGT
jgi:hypothetical protein